MPEITTELRIEGMDCAECAGHVEKALHKTAGVKRVETYPMSLKAKIVHDDALAPLPAIHAAIEGAGYHVTAKAASGEETEGSLSGTRMGFVLGGVFALVLLVVIGGEATGLLRRATAFVPWYVGAILVLAAGGTIFWKVLKNAIHLRATSHTLMSLGAIAALAVGAWVTSLIVILFMRIGERVEGYTTDKARDALRNLTRIAPQTARLLRMTKSAGALGVLREEEVEVPVGEVKVGDVILVRPGERIPVDGKVIVGNASVDQSALTGESMPLDVQEGSDVRAASIATLGSLRVRAERVGEDTTFGRIIKLVEDTEAHRADVQRFADKFTNYFLPVVASIALLTWLLSGNVLAAASVLIVACSCSVALATPIAVLATTGSSAKRGLLIKGGKHLERLAKADTILVDKTGTLTEGKPRLTDIILMSAGDENELLRLVASAERDSEHPLARAVLDAAKARNLPLASITRFRTIPGSGLEAEVNGKLVRIGNHRLASDLADSASASELAKEGKTVVYVTIDEKPAALLAFRDTLRADAKLALADLRSRHRVERVEMLTGDNEETARAIAAELGITYHAQLLPEDKIRIVREHQAKGRVVVMVGDGVNDAPALAQSDVGIAMNGGTDVAMDAAHVILMRDDWLLVPLAFEKARKTMRVIRANLIFTAAFNIIGMGLAAFGFVPPVYAAAAQSIPDVGILANSATLLKDEKTIKDKTNKAAMDTPRAKTGATEADNDDDHAAAPSKVQDLVCQCYVDPKTAKWHSTHAGREYHFCAETCKDSFDEDPKAYVGAS